MTTLTAPVPRGHALNATHVRLELRRVLRNKRTMLVTLGMPPVFFLLFGTAAGYRSQAMGHGNVTAWVMVSMALYGALLAATSGGASVSVERAAGWTRQLRLTPMRAGEYIGTKVVVALSMGLFATLLTAALGLAFGAHADAGRLVAALAITWGGSALFAAFGLLMAYLLPTENAMQVLAPVVALLALAGGVFFPLGDGPFATIARVLPTYGLAQLARAPLTGDAVQPWWVVNVAVWGVVFVVGAAWRLRHDSARS
jgi:ABC-2 type transport system permease protein